MQGVIRGRRILSRDCATQHTAECHWLPQEPILVFIRLNETCPCAQYLEVILVINKDYKVKNRADNSALIKEIEISFLLLCSTKKTWGPTRETAPNNQPCLSTLT